MRFFCIVESIIIKNFVGSSFKSPLMKSLFIGEDVFLGSSAFWFGQQEHLYEQRNKNYLKPLLGL
jgi:hypothetical protein